MARHAQLLDSERSAVSDLFGGQRRFQMPLYQRQYVWDEEQLSDLWDDIDALLDGQAEVRFLGALVLKQIESDTGRKSSLWYVIDGQQRITTLFLLVAAIADVAQESNYPELSESIASRQLLLTTKIDTNKPKITPTYRDLQQFNDVLQFIEKPTPVLLPPHGSPTGLVLDAFATLSQGVRDRIETIAAEIEAGSREIEVDEKDTAGDGSSLHFALDFFHDLVMERIEFIEIFLDDRHDPNEVFERLNSAGQPLDEADFVRNDVFQRIPADPDLAGQIYHHNWEPFEESFGEGEVGRKLHNKYYWPFTLTFDSTITQSRMLTALKKRWDEDTKDLGPREVALTIIDDLERYLPAYLGLAADRRPDGITEDVWTSLRQLRDARLPTTAYPFFLQLVLANLNEAKSDKETILICRIVESFLVRRGLTGQEPTGLFAIFKNLWDKSEGADPTLTRKHITSRTIEFPTNEALTEKILDHHLYNGKVAPYVISQYEEHLQANSKEPLQGLPAMTIDHLMPQDHNGDWKSAVSKEDHERLVHTWGNLVPLSRGANSLKGNKSWSEAKALLEKETKFESAKEVLMEKTWTAAKIQERGQRLAEWAVSRWPTFDN